MLEKITPVEVTQSTQQENKLLPDKTYWESGVNDASKYISPFLPGASP